MNIPEVFYAVDVLFVAFVLFFVVSGLLRGLSGALASLLALLALLCGVCFFYPTLTQIAARNWGTLPPMMIQLVVLVVLLLVAILLSFLMNILFKQMFKDQMGVVPDRIAGSLVGLLRGALIGLSLMAALSLLPNEKLYAVLSEKSVVGGWVCNRFTPWLYPRLMELPVFDQKEN